MFILGLIGLLGASKSIHASGYRDISGRRNYPVMAKYDSNGILRYCSGKRAGKPVGGMKALKTTTTVRTQPVAKIMTYNSTAKSISEVDEVIKEMNKEIKAGTW
jgi:hypothetical protein